MRRPTLPEPKTPGWSTAATRSHCEERGLPLKSIGETRRARLVVASSLRPSCPDSPIRSLRSSTVSPPGWTASHTTCLIPSSAPPTDAGPAAHKDHEHGAKGTGAWRMTNSTSWTRPVASSRLPESPRPRGGRQTRTRRAGHWPDRDNRQDALAQGHARPDCRRPRALHDPGEAPLTRSSAASTAPNRAASDHCCKSLPPWAKPALLTRVFSQADPFRYRESKAAGATQACQAARPITGNRGTFLHIQPCVVPKTRAALPMDCLAGRDKPGSIPECLENPAATRPA